MGLISNSRGIRYQNARQLSHVRFLAKVQYSKGSNCDALAVRLKIACLKSVTECTSVCILLYLNINDKRTNEDNAGPSHFCSRCSRL